MQLTFRRCLGMAKAKIPTNLQIQQEWNQYSQKYNTFDLAPQTFYYSLASVMELEKATNILEVACGTGKLLPFALDRKRIETKYVASDLAPNMVQLAKNNLKEYFLKYESKLTFEEWSKKQNIEFATINAEEPIQNHLPFDRIICNLALMITQNPTKMLKNLNNHSAKGCLFGLSVWGNKHLNPLMIGMRQAITESGFDLPDVRSNFHLYKKVGQLAEQTGWEVVLNWDQNVIFPVLQYSPDRNKELFHYQINKMPAEQRDKVRDTMEKKVTKIFEEKKGLNFACQLYVLRKK